MNSRTLFRLSLAFICAAISAQAEVKLPALFSDQMVLQQGLPLKIWGWADADEEVTITFRNQQATIKSSGGGKWMVVLKPEKAGGPDTLTVSGKNKIVVNDVLVGEVWLASGQSNMEWSMNRSYQAAIDIGVSANPKFRHFNVPRVKSDEPLMDVKAKWAVAAPETTPGFSAVAYYFGRDLQKALDVPVGIIHTSWGGSPAEVWMSDKTLSGNPDYKRDIVDAFATQAKKLTENVAQWEKEKAAAEKEGKPFTKRRPAAGWKPSELYNAMIAPLVPYAVKGAIWYQGESNAGRAHQYRSLYADMIQNWRKDWGQGDFTFLGVQLAPFDKSRKRSLAEITAAPVESDWAELREAQVLSTQLLRNCGLAVITDVGDKDDIHPSKKEPVGGRLALAARGIAYGEKKLVWSGPAYKSLRVQNGKAVLSFDHRGGGLESRGGELTGFAICGADRKFVWGQAEIQGGTVVVSSPQVAEPVAVRFGWADYPVVNLYNQEGLPASPFRTDNFPMTTEPKKP